ncbi:SGNH/GDSL hydrolase family protein [Sutcliffiella rhizosphaerae]|uniref:SGNH/GDSL hydrolase family protein n=1 Tax=Sutcliffiella rhizosphaerae TaxID=2880967 RepID=A0ABM8YN51_9BACI|nr:SGNH/GDSL hydrolase family protein [Sutcliffiella rhizosphaerae]CAG9621392.1 hypothetical protein BACCIP111883_02165 [Sutcliffiella rhizosphaerae]
MRTLLTVVISLCIGSIIYGNYHWNHKIGSASVGKEEEITINNKTETTKDKKEHTKVVGENEYPNLPTEVSTFLNEKMSDGESVELLVIGSEVIEMGERPWTTIFKQELEREYGRFFNITIKAIPGEVTTSDVIERDLLLENVDISPDIVIFEPFLLDSNGYILIEHSLENITLMIEKIKNMNPDLFLFLQPGQPIYNAIYYPDDVNTLRTYSEEHGHPYIDHWSNWPDYHSVEFKEYYIHESFNPNEKGHEVWAEYLLNLFMSKE